jgi:ribose transport system substrate-binding protein
MKVLKSAMGLILFLLLSFLVSCGGKGWVAEANPAVAGVEQAGLFSELSASDEYIFINCLRNIEFFSAHKYGWEKAGELFGVKTSYMGPADFDIPGMVAAFDMALAKNPKGIIVWGVDPSLKPSINKAKELGIPVVTIVGDLPDSNRSTYVGSYQYDLGYVGGKGFAESVKGRAKVGILTLPGVSMFDEREQGFRDAFAEYPGIEVVAVGDTKADVVIAMQTAKDIMVRFPALDGFVGTDSTAAMGAATAVEEMGKVGEISIVGMDRNTDLLKKIEEGVITASVAQGDVMVPFWAMMALISERVYNPMLTSDNLAAKARVTPDVIYIPSNYIDKSNLEYYLAANAVYAD